MKKRKERKPARGEQRDTPTGKEIFIEAIDLWVSVKSTAVRSYYYAIPVPQELESRTIIGLFDERIGDLEWTNFTRAETLPPGHEAMIYKVSLSVRPTEQVRVSDIFQTLQHGSISIQIGTTQFINEPLCFFPVTIYGEIAARENDLLQTLAVMTDIPDGLTDETQKKIMASLSGIAIPTWIAESEPIRGCIDLEPGDYWTPGFDLFVVLHSVTTMPVE